MNNDLSCIICEKPFPYRKGKLYCCDSCKTKAYNIKKSGEAIPGTETTNSISRTTFYLTDYTKSDQKSYCTFEEYCFLIRNFSDQDNDLGFINDFVGTIVRTEIFFADMQNQNHPLKKKYLIFIDKFHDGHFAIKKERPVQTSLE